MFKVDVYAYGSGYRARAHHHPAEADARCDERCEYGSAERTYERQRESPSELRQRVSLSAALALMSSDWSHGQWLLDVGEQMVLPLDL